MEISHSPWPWLRSDAMSLAGYVNMMTMMPRNTTRQCLLQCGPRFWHAQSDNKLRMHYFLSRFTVLLPARYMIYAKRVLFSVAYMSVCVCVCQSKNWKKIIKIVVTWYEYVLWWTVEVITFCLHLTTSFDLESCFRICLIRRSPITWKYWSNVAAVLLGNYFGSRSRYEDESLFLIQGGSA